MSIITVRYGKDQKTLFNSNCRNDILLDYIRKKCGFIEVDCVDIADDRGLAMMLHQNPTQYANEVLADRGVYILVKVEDDKENDGKKVFTPLLETDEVQHMKFVSDLNDLNKKAPPKGKKK